MRKRVRMWGNRSSGKQAGRRTLSGGGGDKRSRVPNWATRSTRRLSLTLHSRGRILPLELRGETVEHGLALRAGHGPVERSLGPLVHRVQGELRDCGGQRGGEGRGGSREGQAAIGAQQARNGANGRSGASTTPPRSVAAAGRAADPSPGGPTCRDTPARGRTSATPPAPTPHTKDGGGHPHGGGTAAHAQQTKGGGDGRGAAQTHRAGFPPGCPRRSTPTAAPAGFAPPRRRGRRRRRRRRRHHRRAPWWHRQRRGGRAAF